MTARALVGLACVFLLANCPRAQEAKKATYADSIAAVVRDQVITVYELHQETRDEEETLRARYSGEELQDKVFELRKNAALKLIERELIAAEFEDLGAQVPADVLQERIDRVVVARSGGDRQAFEDALHDEDLTWGEFEEKMRKRLMVELYLQEFILRNVKISPSVVRDYYEKNADEFSQEARIRLQAIVLEPSAESSHVIRSITEALAAGTSFGELARKHTAGMNAENGGDQGWMKVADVNPKLLDAVRGVSAGEVAGPTKIGSKTYFFKVVERQQTGLRPLDEALKREIEAELRRSEEARRYRELIARLREKFFVKTFF